MCVFMCTHAWGLWPWNGKCIRFDFKATFFFKFQKHSYSWNAKCSNFYRLAFYRSKVSYRTESHSNFIYSATPIQVPSLSTPEFKSRFLSSKLKPFKIILNAGNYILKYHNQQRGPLPAKYLHPLCRTSSNFCTYSIYT